MLLFRYRNSHKKPYKNICSIAWLQESCYNISVNSKKRFLMSLKRNSRLGVAAPGRFFISGFPQRSPPLPG